MVGGDILKRLQSEDKRVRWFSRQDNGPAQAINNALAQARGTIIGWLNSDDLYMAGAVSSAVQALDDCPDWLMVYGQGQHISATGQKLDIYPTLPPPQPLSSFMHGCFICQPTVFFRRSMYVLLGGLDETFETAFDFDYWLKAFSAFTNRIGFVDRLQASSRFHDACITLRQRRTVALEGVQLLARHVGTAPIEWLLTYRNELLNGKAQLPEGMSLKQELTALLKDAEAYFDERDLQRLAEQFDVKEL